MIKKLLALCAICIVLINSVCIVNATTKAQEKISIPVLLYHHFMEDDVPEERYSTTITGAQFENQIKTLTENGYNSISLEELKAYIEDGIALPKNPYIISMDDGYDSNYNIMYPILKKYNAKAVIFVIGNMIREEPGKHWNKNSLVWMTWDMLKEMEDSGLVEIQNHGYIHKPADKLMDEEFRESVINGEELLNEKLGERKVKTFAYPHGKATTYTKQILKENGYIAHFMVNPGTIKKTSKMDSLPRIIVSYGKTGEDVIKLIKKYS